MLFIRRSYITPQTSKTLAQPCALVRSTFAKHSPKGIRYNVTFVAMPHSLLRNIRASHIISV